MLMPSPTPDFDLFNTYYGGNDYDLHTISLWTFWRESLSPISRSSNEEIVVGILRSVVMYLFTLAELDSAVTECDKNGGSVDPRTLGRGVSLIKEILLVGRPVVSLHLD
jgi:hypothetical protein